MEVNHKNEKDNFKSRAIANQDVQDNGVSESLQPPVFQLKINSSNSDQIEDENDQSISENYLYTFDIPGDPNKGSNTERSPFQLKPKNKSSKDSQPLDKSLATFGSELNEFVRPFAMMEPPPMIVSNHKLIRKIAHYAYLFSETPSSNTTVRTEIYNEWNSGVYSDILHTLSQIENQYPDQARIGKIALERISDRIISGADQDVRFETSGKFGSVTEILSPEEKAELNQVSNLLGQVIKISQPYMKVYKKIDKAISSLPGKDDKSSNGGKKSRFKTQLEAQTLNNSVRLKSYKQIKGILDGTNSWERLQNAETLEQKFESVTDFTSKILSSTELFVSKYLGIHKQLLEDYIKKNALGNIENATNKLTAVKNISEKVSGAFKTVGGALSLVQDSYNFYKAWEEEDWATVISSGLGIIGSVASIVEGVSLYTLGGEAATTAIAGGVGTVAGGASLYVGMWIMFSKEVGDMYETIAYLKDEKVRNWLNFIISKLDELVANANQIARKEQRIEEIATKPDKTLLDDKLMMKLGENIESTSEYIYEKIKYLFNNEFSPDDFSYPRTKDDAKNVRFKLDNWENYTPLTFDLLQSFKTLVKDLVGYHKHGQIGYEVRKQIENVKNEDNE